MITTNFAMRGKSALPVRTSFKSEQQQTEKSDACFEAGYQKGFKEGVNRGYNAALSSSIDIIKHRFSQAIDEIAKEKKETENPNTYRATYIG